MSEEEARAAAVLAVWQLGALSTAHRRRDIETTTRYILTGSWEVES